MSTFLPKKGLTREQVEAIIAENGAGLPDQTGNAGEFLTTDGTDASWTTIAGAVGSAIAVGGTPVETLAFDPDDFAVTVDGDTATITVTATGVDAETVRDTIAAALVAGDNITITHDDVNDTITIDAASGGGSSAITMDGTPIETIEFDDTDFGVDIAGTTATITVIGGGGGGGESFKTRPLHRVGYYLDTGSNTGGSTSTLTVGLNTLYYLPFIPQESGTIDELQIEVTTLSAGVEATAGFYTATAEDIPSAVAATAASAFDFSTTGFKSATIDFDYTAGEFYWLALHCEGGGAVRAMVNPVPRISMATAANGVTGAYTQVTAYTGTLPAVGTLTYPTTAIPRIWYRRSA